MSDVRLSNASPTVERVDARQQDNVRPPTRRNLFGTPDREETRRYFEASIQESVQAFVEEYNFDVVNDRPLTPPRRYDWQEDNDAPEYFRRPPHRREQQPQREVEPAFSLKKGEGEAAQSTEYVHYQVLALISVKLPQKQQTM
uniref:Cyclin-dependent kinase inhibitor 1B n=1 Tax=Labrus bergylta TaxID=56723 RepID=A0A3Q3H1Y0_9LABR